MPRFRSKILLVALTALAGATLGGCRSGDGSDVFHAPGAGTGTGTTDTSPVSATTDAAKAEIANNTSETTTSLDTTTVGSREDNPETSTPVAVTF